MLVIILSLCHAYLQKSKKKQIISGTTQLFVLNEKAENCLQHPNNMDKDKKKMETGEKK